MNSATDRRVKNRPKTASYVSRLLHTRNPTPSSSNNAARIGSGKLGSSSTTLRYSRGSSPEVFAFHAAPNSTLCGAPHNVDYAENGIMRSAGF